MINGIKFAPRLNIPYGTWVVLHDNEVLDIWSAKQREVARNLGLVLHVPPNADTIYVHPDEMDEIRKQIDSYAKPGS